MVDRDKIEVGRKAVDYRMCLIERDTESILFDGYPSSSSF